jgi:hypothetical protein
VEGDLPRGTVSDIVDGAKRVGLPRKVDRQPSELAVAGSDKQRDFKL